MGEDQRSFIVGPNDAAAKTFVVADVTKLLSSSEVFAAMLSSPLTPDGPVRLKGVEPRIFQLMLRYIKADKMKSLKKLKLNDSIALCLAADFFFMENLLEFALTKLAKFLKVSNVWHVLNQVNHIPKLAVVCDDILSSRTVQCLKHPTFYDVTVESLVYFLKLDFMTVDSEVVLYDAVRALSRHHNYELKWMIAALPHLRLPSLSCPDVLKGFNLISKKVLKKKEKTALAYKMKNEEEDWSKKPWEKLFVPPRLCPITYPRQPKRGVVGLICMYDCWDRTDCYNQSVSSVLALKTSHQSLTLDGLDVLAPIVDNCECEYIGDHTQNCYVSDILNTFRDLSLTFFPNDGKGIWSTQLVKVQDFTIPKVSGGSAHVKFKKAILVPKGYGVKIALALYPESGEQAAYAFGYCLCIDPCYKKTFSEISFRLDYIQEQFEDDPIDQDSDEDDDEGDLDNILPALITNLHITLLEP